MTTTIRTPRMGNDMRHKSRIGLLTSAVILAALSCASAQEKKVRLATDGNYPPFNFTDPSGKVIGFEVDLAGEPASAQNSPATGSRRASTG